MAILVGGKGPIGGIQFYPKEVQERVLELGMITKKQLKKQQFISVLLLVFLDVVILFLMIFLSIRQKVIGILYGSGMSFLWDRSFLTGLW